MRSARSSGLIGTCAALLAFAAPILAVDSAVLLRQLLETLQAAPGAAINGERIASAPFLQRFYARRDFQLAWAEPGRIEELIGLVEATAAEGLDPEDYHATALRRMQQARAAGQGSQVDFDIMLTDALVSLGAHLRFGKVDPVDLDPNWNIARDLRTDDPVAVLQAAIDADSLQAYIDERIPRQPFYQRFKDALARYRGIRDAGGWGTVPEGAALKPGMNDPRVPAVRARLAAEGDLAKTADKLSDLYDAEVEEAVKRFQARHVLADDGVAGRQTLVAMNVPVQARIDQIKANLERSRWVFTDLTGDFIVVNIAGYEAYLVRNDEVAWSTAVMVGKTYRKTPVFKAEMRYLVLNPTWTIPPGILRRDIIPNMKKDPGYLARKGYLLLDRDGNPVDESSVDYASLAPGNFPYIVRQPAGPNNALGQVKFIFPNSHFVFLHDTNHRELFAQRERAFSSGCIRVRDPIKLAELVLEDRPDWGLEAIERALAGKQTQTVHLKEPLPVLLLYWTVRVSPEDGRVSFLRDVYERDASIIAGLAAPYGGATF